MTKRNSLHLKRLVIALCAVMCLFGFLLSSPAVARAEENKKYSSVIQDLSRDPNFNLSDYPEKTDDYGIDVIQIAESEYSELYLYTYAPCRKKGGVDMRPTQVSLAFDTDTDAFHYALYGLNEVSRDGTLTKYVVKGFAVDTGADKRYYAVSMLQRIDANGDAVAEAVEKLWTVETAEGGTTYTETHKETIEVLDPLAGSVRYVKDKAPANWGLHGVDSHFVAFNTDLPIDDLLEADVTYMTVPIGAAEGTITGGIGSTPSANGIVPIISVLAELMASEGDISAYNKPTSKEFITAAKRAAEKKDTKPKTVTVYKDSSYTFATNGWYGGRKFKWDQIQQIDGFKNSLEDGKIVCLSGEYTSGDLENKQWILRYRETPYDDEDNKFEAWFENVGGYWYDFDIAVLRLKFETNGQVYDLGTVSDKVNQTIIIQGNTSQSLWDKFLAWVKKIMARLFGISADSIPDWAAVLFIVGVAIVGVVLLMILMPFMPMIASFTAMCVKGLAKGVMYLFKGIFYVLSLPVRGVIALVRRKRSTPE